MYFPRPRLRLAILLDSETVCQQQYSMDPVSFGILIREESWDEPSKPDENELVENVAIA